MQTPDVGTAAAAPPVSAGGDDGFWDKKVEVPANVPPKPGMPDAPQQVKYQPCAMDLWRAVVHVSNSVAHDCTLQSMHLGHSATRFFNR